jgi:hypothetical protein
LHLSVLIVGQQLCDQAGKGWRLDEFHVCNFIRHWRIGQLRPGLHQPPKPTGVAGGMPDVPLVEVSIQIVAQTR